MLALLKDTWTEVAFLLGIGSGFWIALEPPTGGPTGVLSGFVGAFVVAAALGVRGTLQHWRDLPVARVTTLVLAVVFLVAAVPTFATYVADRSNLVLPYGTEKVELVRGTTYHTEILGIKMRELKTDSDLLDAAGGAEGREFVWRRASILTAERRLIVGYLLTLLFTLIATMLFVEVLRFERASPPPR